MSTERGAHVSDLMLEQYRLNELPRDDAERLQRRLATDEDLRTRLEALERSDRDIEARYPPGWLAQGVRERMAAQIPRRSDRRYVLAGAFAAGALAIAVAIPWNSVVPSAEGDRVKGLVPALTVYRRTPAGSETLADGAPARTGDLIRLGYVSAGREYGAILSIDGRGVVTQHLPPNGTRAATLRAGGTVLLDEAYELDDAPAWERFYFVTAGHAFEVAPILEAARRAAALDPRSPPKTLPIADNLEQVTFSLQKEVRP